ncbi:hypothetical protein CYLTODRAFT_406120 [Cylindrobasidium torrendii FP15055 ss-10]|uniref:Uncharacterized protein n=1 Tax=Cylindrobasidium torrendii FP15055 ss-10 TaxID=1314674 RepID=A0A0D7BUG9_9AGAR|nr:hypothetical protein CYLTODRAFT_406120 [Cylindrobasidium torrendii FP15055 ss-10]
MGLSGRVNQYQDWFYVADLFPFAFSVISVALLLLLLIPLAVGMARSRRMSLAAMRIMQIGVYTVLSVFWLCSNAFSTNRWNGIPLDCNALVDTADEEADLTAEWCNALKALRVIVWILWAGFLGADFLAYKSPKEDYRSNIIQWDLYGEDGMSIRASVAPSMLSRSFTDPFR